MRVRPLASLMVAAALTGCGDNVSTQTTSVPATPPEVLEATPTTEAEPAATTEPEQPDSAPKLATEAAEPPATPPSLPSLKEAAAALEPEATAESTNENAGVTLKRLSWEDFRRQVVTDPNAKLTLVDAWATTCGPCKENFPHLVEMSKKYADKGLKAVSLTLDDREDSQAIAEAEKFLREQNATFTNVLLDEDFGVGYEKLDINAIPAVFVFGPDGREVKRYTLDDPDNQFTYEQVEKDVAAMLEAP